MWLNFWSAPNQFKCNIYWGSKYLGLHISGKGCFSNSIKRRNEWVRIKHEIPIQLDCLLQPWVSLLSCLHWPSTQVWCAQVRAFPLPSCSGLVVLSGNVHLIYTCTIHPSHNVAGAVNLLRKANSYSLSSGSVASPSLLSFGLSLASISVSQRVDSVTAESPKCPWGLSITIELLLSMYLTGLQCISLPGTSEELHKFSGCRILLTKLLQTNVCHVQGAQRFKGTVRRVPPPVSSSVGVYRARPAWPPKARCVDSPRAFPSTDIPDNVIESTSPREKPEVKDFRDQTNPLTTRDS